MGLPHLWTPVHRCGSSEHFTDDDLVASQADIYATVHDLVGEMNGSISAEHGIGQLKVGEMTRYKSVQEIRLMTLVKKALDPQGLLNPGKVLPSQ